MRILCTVASVAVLSGWCAAQTVWSMGAPWTDLTAVIAAAAPGDVVLLNGLAFPPFVLDKGLTIVGPGIIRPAVGGLGQFTSLAIPAGQRAHVAGVDFLPLAVLFVYPHRVVAAGVVTFENCVFGEGAPHSLELSGTTLLHHCTVASMSTSWLAPDGVVGGVVVTGGVCCIAGSTLHGAHAHFATQIVDPPSTGLRVQAGTVYVSNSTLSGGNGLQTAMFGSAAAAPAVQVGSGSVQIADCILQAGASPPNQPGPAALVGTSATSWARSTLTGGAGSTTGGASSGPVQQVPQLVGMRIGQSFRLGSSTALTAIAGSAQPLGMFAGFDATSTTHPIVLGPIFGASTQPAPLLLTTPTAGAPIVHTTFVPNTPQLLGVAVVAQAFQLDGGLVRASAAVGGVVH